MGKCVKVTTKASDKKECSANSDCAADAYCTCNYEVGNETCVPYPYSDKGVIDGFKSIMNEEIKCQDSDCFYEIQDKYESYYNYIMAKYMPYSERFICYDESNPVKPNDSSSNTDGSASLAVSVFAMALALLFALNL